MALDQKIRLLFLSACLASPLMSEAFGNNEVSVPKIGMAFFDVPSPLNDKPWGISRMWSLSTSFTKALDYRWWWVVDTGLGLGRMDEDTKPYLGAFFGGTGVRLNLLHDDIRPHLGLMVHYLHFLGKAARDMPLDLGWPIFVGLRPSAGIDWLFFSEMALTLDAGYGVYININEPFRQVFYASVGFSVFF